MATAPAFVTLSNGEKLAAGVYEAFLKLQKAAYLATGEMLWIASGYRTHATQVAIFVSRYQRQIVGSGRYNDVRYWDGSRYGYPGTNRWVRTSPEGTVAVPGTSLHEKASAVDWGGNGGLRNSRLNNWLRANAIKYGFSPTGYSFGEPWHYDYIFSPWATSGSTPFEPVEQEEEEVALTDDEIYKIAHKVWSWSAQAGDYNMADIVRKTWRESTQGEAGIKHHGNTYAQILAGRRGVDELVARPGSTVSITDEQIAKIASLVIASIDINAIARAVADEAARRMAE